MKYIAIGIERMGEVTLSTYERIQERCALNSTNHGRHFHTQFSKIIWSRRFWRRLLCQMRMTYPTIGCSARASLYFDVVFYFSETTRPNFFNYKINIYENIGLFICIFVAWNEVHSAHFRQVRKSFCYDFDYAKRHGFALCREFCWILCGHFGWLAHHTKSEMYYICIIPSSIECVQLYSTFMYRSIAIQSF